ncbi:hypothetical protein [Rothia sp. ZJ1223]|uniref:hypothetical protein n=1 Tax=Rothia sp. ZJ1223 TaxID=2811098 RepID=UPI00195E5B5F|nr:hypothetical protein [Rothia sp. ZJ1223]MBM7051479.1 hypothetical protein [Rothia sp. ZJ1223]
MSYPTQTPPFDAKRQAEKVTVWRRATILLTLLALMILLNAAQWAWVSSVLFVLAIVTISMTIARLAPLKPPVFSYILYSCMILFCVLLAFSSAVTALFSGVSGEYAQCTQQATTIARAQQCSTDMENSLMDALTGK